MLVFSKNIIKIIAQIKSVLFILFLITHEAESSDGISNREHLKLEHIRKACLNRKNICLNAGPELCAVQKISEKYFYKEFENACYLHLNNVCDTPGQEYLIISSEYCRRNDSQRRFIEETVNGDVYTTETINEEFNSTDAQEKTNGTNLEERKQDQDEDSHILRQGNVTKDPLGYLVKKTFKGKKCPLSCPNIYSPVCFSVNKKSVYGYKLLYFVNQCEGLIYYCKHPNEFDPLPGNTKEISTSKISWSYCASFKTMQIVRFMETASALHRYGWLAGNHKATHIMEPNERIKNYG